MTNKVKNHLEDLTEENVFEIAEKLSTEIYYQYDSLKWREIGYQQKVSELIKKIGTIGGAKVEAQTTQEYIDYKDKLNEVNFLQRQFDLVKTLID